MVTRNKGVYRVNLVIIFLMSFSMQVATFITLSLVVTKMAAQGMAIPVFAFYSTVLAVLAFVSLILFLFFLVRVRHTKPSDLESLSSRIQYTSLLECKKFFTLYIAISCFNVVLFFGSAFWWLI